MLLTQDQEMIRDAVRDFAQTELWPHAARWDKEHHFPKEAHQGLAALGAYGICVPEEFGGANLDYVTLALVLEEIAAGDGGTSTAISVTNCPVNAILLRYGNAQQKRDWLTPLARGEMLGAFCLTEPHVGSDASALRTTAVKQGDEYVINGVKQFITSGKNGHVAIVIAVTDKGAGKKGMSAFLVPTSNPGYVVARLEDKLGQHSSDTAQINLENCRVPAENLLGGPAMENRGFICLMEQLPWERLQIAITAVAAAQAAIDWTLDYVKQRKVFGQSVASFQNTRHTLAELQTQVQVARVFVDKCCELIVRDQLDTETASMAKYWTTDLQCKVMDECVQLHGGYGYMWEYPITRAYADARVQRIYGGTNEIMKELASRFL